MMKKNLERDSAANSLGENEILQFESAISTDRQAFVYFALGKFGMRVGELAHMSYDWFVLTPNQEHIKIPLSTRCILDCSRCKKRGGMWNPKTKNGARTIPGRIDIDAFWFMEAYLKKGNIPPSERRARTIIYNIERKAKLSHNVFPHALRATAAQRVATMANITAPDLMGIFGWADLKIANEYIKASGTVVLRRFNNREEASEINSVVRNLSKVTKFHDVVKDSFKCPICGSNIVYKEDDTWECVECGAESGAEQ